MTLLPNLVLTGPGEAAFGVLTADSEQFVVSLAPSVGQTGVLGI